HEGWVQRDSEKTATHTKSGSQPRPRPVEFSAVPVLAFASLRSNDAPGMGVADVGVISDAQLLALASESQKDALDALYNAYKSRIYTFLLRFLADPHLADDVTQEVFTKAFHALPD